jgi:hypothetical protein
MPTIEIMTEQLVQAAKLLPPRELDQVVEELLEERAHRRAPCLSSEESRLFERINRALPDHECARYRQLVRKRDAETLTDADHIELIRLSDKIEVLEADRLGALIQLAQLWGTSLGKLKRSLGIRRPRYA